MDRLRKKPTIVSRNGKWIVDYYIEGNKRVRRSFVTKALAVSHQKEVLKTRSGSNDPYTRLKVESNELRHSEVTLKDALAQYFTLVSSKKLSVANEKAYFPRFEKFMRDGFNVHYVADIIKPYLLAYQAHRKDLVKSSSVNREFNTLKHFFGECVDWGYIKDTPFTRLKNLPEVNETREVWSKTELQMVMRDLDPLYADILFVMAKTGARNSEVLKLEWSDVNFNKNYITLHSKKGMGRKVTRMVPLVRELKELLIVLKAESQNSGLVFKNVYNKELSKHAFSTAVVRSCKKLGLGNKSAYGLRHTLGTELAKVNLEVARKVLGHSSLVTTQKYIHFDNEEISRVMEEVNIGTGH